MNTNICRYCYKEIRDRDELITASNWFRVRPYHYRCFELLEQDTKTIAGAWTPVNGLTGMVTTVLMMILSVLMFTTNILGFIGDILGLVALYPIFLRVFSFAVFESRLPKYVENKKRQ
ncbi:hypothetical protein SAMN05216353_14518 [Halobacillus alkaliphilus]|uniref:Uncharacterized protein n=1 Tax=Halobacillus alkaliphilus TaxID=396056 RepID=A0A1I2S0F3_9BACI|nr:hypothetical protein [Halobacillus alkaliphilus]SFG46210.1 hypothetical protein SAMN05216353_14518 [Halobacillus alkaliphilus]